MASKIKSGLWRIQVYLSDENYSELLPEIEESGLSESAFFSEKITGMKQVRRGAPNGNQNAKKKGFKKDNMNQEKDWEAFNVTNEEVDQLLETLTPNVKRK